MGGIFAYHVSTLLNIHRVLINREPLYIFCNFFLCCPVSITDIPNWFSDNWLGYRNNFTYSTYEYSLKIMT